MLFMSLGIVDEVLDWAFPDRQYRQLHEIDIKREKIMERIQNKVVAELEKQGKVYHPRIKIDS